VLSFTNAEAHYPAQGCGRASAGQLQEGAQGQPVAIWRAGARGEATRGSCRRSARAQGEDRV